MDENRSNMSGGESKLDYLRNLLSDQKRMTDKISDWVKTINSEVSEIGKALAIGENEFGHIRKEADRVAADVTDLKKDFEALKDGLGDRIDKAIDQRADQNIGQRVTDLETKIAELDKKVSILTEKDSWKEKTKTIMLASIVPLMGVIIAAITLWFKIHTYIEPVTK